MRGLRRGRAWFFIPFCVLLDDFKVSNLRSTHPRRFFHRLIWDSSPTFFFKIVMFIIKSIEEGINYIFYQQNHHHDNDWDCSGRWCKSTPWNLSSYLAVLDSNFPHCHLSTYRPAFGPAPTLTDINHDWEGHEDVSHQHIIIFTATIFWPFVQGRNQRCVIRRKRHHYAWEDNKTFPITIFWISSRRFSRHSFKNESAMCQQKQIL